MEKYISKLINYINENKEEKAELMEDAIAESFDEAVHVKKFYSLPMKNILSITQKSTSTDKEVYKTLIEKTNEIKGHKSAFLLYYINPDLSKLDDYVDIISSFSDSTFCQKFTEMFKEEIQKVERDYEYEIETLKRSNEELAKQVQEYKDKEEKASIPRIVSMRVVTERK